MGITQELQCIDHPETSDLEHELELNKEQMNDVVSKLEEIKFLARKGQISAMQENRLIIFLHHSHVPANSGV
jgi:hypothetical protein